MSGGECTGAVRSRLAALKKAVKHHNTGGHGNDESDNAHIANHAANNRHVVLRQVQPVVVVASRAKDLARLDYLRCQAVAVHRIVLAAAGLDELGTDSEELQVSLLLYGVGTQHFQKLGQCRFRQPLDIVVAGKYRPIAFAQHALELDALRCVLVRLVALLCRSLTAGEVLTPLPVLHLHELLAFFFVHDDAMLGITLRLFRFLLLLASAGNFVIIFYDVQFFDIIVGLLLLFVLDFGLGDRSLKVLGVGELSNLARLLDGGR